MFTTRLIESIIIQRRRRQATLDLANLSEHQLRDLGVTRHDLFAPSRYRKDA